MGRQARIRRERRLYTVPKMGLVEMLYLALALVLGTERTLPTGPANQKTRRIERRKRSTIMSAILWSSGVE